jgi:hypothetical protein
LGHRWVTVEALLSALFAGGWSVGSLLCFFGRLVVGWVGGVCDKL